jgi:hypothetical protein
MPQIVKERSHAPFTGTATASRAVNRSLIGLYWAPGQMIVERQEELGWGSAVVDQLSTDLRNEFPDMSGFHRASFGTLRAFMKPTVPLP